MIRLEELRLDAGLTPEQLGAEAGVAGATVRRIEAGERATPKTLVKLAAHFGVRASELQRPIAELVAEPDRGPA